MTIDQRLRYQAWVCPQQFLMPKIRKLAKNMACFENFVVGVRWENCTELFYVMCPSSHRGIKISASNFEGLSPLKILEPINLSFQLRHFATLLQISPDMKVERMNVQQV